MTLQTASANSSLADRARTPIVMLALLFAMPLAVAVPLQHCRWIDNLTDTISLPEHKYVIIEECLYYNLSQKADRLQHKPSALITLPPTNTPGQKVTINVDKMMINQLWINEIWKEMNIAGYISVDWYDYRLQWDAFKWKVGSLAIKSYGHLWVPDMFTGSFGTASRTNDYTIFKDIQTTSKGVVSAKLQYRIQAVCKVDYYDYPVDERSCCFDLHSNLFSDLVRFNLKTSSGSIDPNEGQTNWQLRSVKMKTKTHENGAEIVNVCIQALRKSSTLKIELTVPMVITAVIVVVAPLFGKFTHQLYAKMFSLLLQFLCFKFLVSKTPQVGFSERTPKIYKFYEFTLGMTVLSFLITLVLFALSRVNRALPPSHKFLLVSSAVNTYLCCTEGADDKATGAGNNKEDWKQIFAFVNNVLSLVVMVAYVLGVLVLCL